MWIWVNAWPAYEFIGFGAMNKHVPFCFIGFGDQGLQFPLGVQRVCAHGWLFPL